MYFEQFYLGCLAHASYMLASDGEGVVVDPQRDVDLYLEAAQNSYQEAASLYDADALARPTACLLERQRCWNNLGQLFLCESPERGWPDRHQARNAFRHYVSAAP